MKTCNKCKQVKELNQFSKKRNGLNSRCKACIAEYMQSLYLRNVAGEREKRRQYYKDNRETVKTHNKEHYHKNRDSIRIRRLELKFGITRTQYHAKLEEQQGKCANCKESYDKTLAVDHNHQTGEIRGLLCSRCNTALGLLKEDPKRMISLISYVEKYQK